MLYFDVAFGTEDYLTEKEIKLPRIFRKLCWIIKEKFGIILKKKFNDKTVFILPKVNKKFLKKVEKIYKINSDNFFCISDELYYKEEFMNFVKKNKIKVCNGNWVIKFLLIQIFDFVFKNNPKDLENKNIAILVNSDYELVLEYLKLLSNKNIKVITIVTNNVKRFSKFSEKYLSEYDIELDLVNNYKKSISKTDIVVNLDFEEKELKKCTFFSKVVFINLNNKFEIKTKNFEGINISAVQISMPNKYLEYVELFHKFNYLNVYESFIKKKTSYKNIFNEIKKDDLEIICLENKKGIILKNDFDVKKVLDK